MPRGENQKKKLILILRYLQQKSDENHPVSMSDIIHYLDTEGISAERKSIYDDMEALRDLGYDIICIKGRSGGYFLGERDFELAELKILVDAVQASRFIPKNKSNDLIRKLSDLAGENASRELVRDVYVLNRAKSENDSVIYAVDSIHSALRNNKNVRFKYVEYKMDKKIAYRHNGEMYEVSPLGLAWNNERYYLVAFDPKSSKIKHYRVDRMKNISESKKNRELPKEYRNFDISKYSAGIFNMFSGTQTRVSVLFPEKLASVVIDQFGMDVSMLKVDEHTFKASFKIDVSPQFFGWVLSMGNDVRIEGPEEVKEEYVSFLKNNLKQYK